MSEKQNQTGKNIIISLRKMSLSRRQKYHSPGRIEGKKAGSNKINNLKQDNKMNDKVNKFKKEINKYDLAIAALEIIKAGFKNGMAQIPVDDCILELRRYKRLTVREIKKLTK